MYKYTKDFFHIEHRPHSATPRVLDVTTALKEAAQHPGQAISGTVVGVIAYATTHHPIIVAVVDCESVCAVALNTDTAPQLGNYIEMLNPSISREA